LNFLSSISIKNPENLKNLIITRVPESREKKNQSIDYFLIKNAFEKLPYL
jgi:hypothetical protein